jgi:hypothetical protein
MTKGRDSVVILREVRKPYLGVCVVGNDGVTRSGRTGNVSAVCNSSKDLVL